MPKILLSLATGILLAYIMPFMMLIPLALLCLVGCIVFICCSKNNLIATIGFIVCFASFGAVRTIFFYSDCDVQWSSDEHLYKGVVDKVVKNTDRTVRVLAKCECDSISGDHICQLIFIADTVSKRCPAIAEGDTIVFYTCMLKPVTTGNPYEFDSGFYLRNKGVAGTALIFSNRIAYIHHPDNPGLLYMVRNRVEQIITGLDISPESKAIATALTLGNRTGISAQMRQEYSTVGVSHILALSGLHLGIVYMLLSAIILPLCFGNRKLRDVATLFILVLLWTYVLLVGMPYSLMRAAILVTLCSISKLLHRKAWSINNLCIAAIIILLLNPGSIYDVGFQLSFAACLFIMLLQPTISKFSPNNRVVRYFYGIIAVSLAAQIGVAPLSLYYFHNFPVYFLLANLWVIPLVFCIIISLMLLLPVAFVIPASVSVVSLMLGTELEWLQSGIGFMSNLKMASLGGWYPSLVHILLVYAVIFFVIAVISRYSIRRLQLLMLAVVILLAFHTYTLFQNERRIFVIDRFGKPEIVQVCSNRTIEKVCYVDWKNTDGLIRYNSKTYFILDNRIWRYRTSTKKIKVDYLIISKGFNGKLVDVARMVTARNVILHSSLSHYYHSRYVTETRQLRMKVYDMQNCGYFKVPV